MGLFAVACAQVRARTIAPGAAASKRSTVAKGEKRKAKAKEAQLASRASKGAGDQQRQASQAATDPELKIPSLAKDIGSNTSRCRSRPKFPKV
mmetsp:Transcript_10472/g.22254  ORF Transcript_10472/g.22254 Transcript_10472/m.22254 type:complete len:93 (-) Transcript_10472:242-520(-)